MKFCSALNTWTVLGGGGGGVTVTGSPVAGNITEFSSPTSITNAPTSGNSGIVATSSGVLVSGDCVKVDANGNFVDSGVPSCGVGPGTTNFMAKFNSSTTVTNSTCVDDGLNPTRCPDGMDSAAGGFYIERPVDTGGVIAGKLACRSSIKKAVLCPAGTTQGVLGVAQSTQSAGATVEICFAGTCSPISSNATTEGHWLIPSTSIAGDVDDTGSAAEPTTGTQHFQAESAVSGGNAVQTTLLTLDTLNATGGGGSGTITPCTQFGLTYYSAVGSSNTLNCIAPPTANGKYFAIYDVNGGAAVAPTAALGGVPVNAQVGTTYTYLYSDRASYTTFNNASPIAVTLPQAGSTGFGSNWVNVSCAIGAGTVTITPTTSTISYTFGATYVTAAASMALTTGQCAWIYSNNTDYFALQVRTGAVSNIATTSPITGGPITTTGTIACATCVTSAASLTNNQIISGAGGQGIKVNDLSGDVTTSGTMVTTIAANAVTAAKSAVVMTRRTCSIVIGADNGSALADADIGPQGSQCFVAEAGTIVEVDVKANAGTPTGLPRKEHGASNTSLLSAALSTAASGAIACSNTGGTTGIDGTTTCTNTLNSTSLAAGDFIGVASGVAGGTATRLTIHITWVVN